MAVLGLLAGCGDSNETTTGGGGAGGSGAAGGTGGTGGGPQGDTYSFDTDTYTLKSGEQREYMCFTTHVPSDGNINITEIEPIYGKGIHHLAIYTTIVAEPEGTFDCPELVRATWLPVYLGGVDSTKLTMPAGTSLTLPKGAQILVQLHLLNASADTIEDKAGVVFHTTKDETLTKAGVFGFDNRDILIPAQTAAVEQTQACPTVGKDMDVFAVFGHMHQHGKKIEVSRGETVGKDVLYSAEWEFQDQPTVTTDFHIAKEDTVNVRCWFDNPTDKDVTYGESSYEEMCSFILYYTPFTEVDGCVKAAPAP